ncbi:hypothetical protein D1013_15680 [Euzebyella marina]|uniref:Lipooligosaccharide sialyltransferase n=1 Tax=Euzebyella marina TaxID=1761453 RepID=A0A3G2L8X0_9FLAO|nr:glycosyltransferase family 52 [Euzebyella marina]AYN68715.1 hypothetical protein D1013_15680 [Euzebyella marina]
MKRTYVGSTIYHIYLSLLHILKDSNFNTENRGNNLLFLIESTPFIETLIPNLKKNFFRDVHIISERKIHRQELGKFNYSFRRKATLLPYLRKKHTILIEENEFILDSEIYLCDTDSSKSYFLYAYGHKKMNMIEDGARTYNQRHTRLEQFYKTYLTKTPIGGGFDPEIKAIFAQHPDRLPQPIRSKSKELNIRQVVSKLDQSTKCEIFNIFLREQNFLFAEGNHALVLTQPISEDGVIKNENEKIAIYRDILSKIPGDMNIVLKTHPREHTRYEEHFNNITVLPGLFPIEILCLKEGFHFNHGYTLFSTALTNLDIVNKRFFLGKDYLDKFTTKATRNLVKNMVVDL